MKTEWSSRLRVTAAGRVLAIAALGLVIAASANATENILFSFTGANGGAPDGTLRRTFSVSPEATGIIPTTLA
jgi:hypothetical protein